MSNYLTSDDYANYGGELIDVTQRAALSALAPTLQQIQQDNAALQQRLAIEARKRLDSEVYRAVPDLQTIDADPRWHRWLRGVDSLSGQVRQTLLNSAISRGDPHLVKNFFDMFKREIGSSTQPPASTGSTTTRSGPYSSGRSNTSLGSRVYTRDQVAELYSKHRRGKFSESAWAAQEADIMAAAREGRIRHPMDWTGK